MGQTGAALWSGGVSPLSRVNAETNTSIMYPAYGRLNGQATLTALLDGQPLAVTTNASGDSSYPYEWRTVMELTPGAHQLKVAALHPSGFYTAWATNSFTNSLAYETASVLRDGSGNIDERIWLNPDGSTNLIQQFYWDAKNRLTDFFNYDHAHNGFYWHAEYDGLDRRLLTQCYVTTNGITQIYGVTPTTISQYYDPQVEFLELGVSYGTTTEWKLYGPDMNGKYGGLNGTGGFDAVSPYLDLFNPVISDFRGNILAEVTNGVVVWNPSRPTGYGAVPGYRPVALGHGADISLSSAWRGRWVDITGFYNIGMRLYDPVAGYWLSYDSAWNERDPNYLTFCGGDPVNGFDSNGKYVENAPNAINFGIAPVMTTSIQTTTYLNDGTVIPPSPNGSLFDPSQVAGNSYNIVTQPTGQYQYYVSQNALPDNYGQTTVTPITTDQIEAQEGMQFVKGSVAVLAAALTDTEPLLADSGMIDSSLVRFSQDSISGSFKNGGTVNDLAASLTGTGGQELASQIPPIRLVQQDSLLYTLDNRRLAAFSQTDLQVPYRMATPAEISAEWTDKFTTTAQQSWGQFITVRPPKGFKP